MDARYITASEEVSGQLHFENAVENGVGYGQLWFETTFHLELTEEALYELAGRAAELARNL
jgi:hypothetical protein